MAKQINRPLLFMALLLMLFLSIMPYNPVLAAGTTSLTITKYAGDGTTILEQIALSYTDMETYFPIEGDGITHQYLQGPVFEGECPGTDIWDPDETCNIKDWGANKGTDLMYLCELVGGMSPGDTVKIKATDGLSRTYD